MYCDDNSELAEFEAVNKGFRYDIFVQKEGKFFQLNVYNIVRLKQDYETEYEYSGFYSVDPNIILVNEVTLSEIRATIEKLDNQGYFEKIKPLELVEVNIESLYRLE